MPDMLAAAWAHNESYDSMIPPGSSTRAFESVKRQR